LATKINRPTITVGKVIHKMTGCGDLAIQVMGDGNGRNPIEVMAQLGKSGDCAKCQNASLSLVITTGLKYGVPPEEFIDKLRGHSCPGQMPGGADRILSCPDAIARALREFLDENRQV
jgi:ribonucleoside-diphosphate reductase alpha chain